MCRLHGGSRHEGPVEGGIGIVHGSMSCIRSYSGT